jgi:hypothetical protein
MRSMVRVAALLGLAGAVLSGCGAISQQAWLEVGAPPESEALVALPESFGAGGAGLRVRVQDRSELEEYAAYDGSSGRAEFLYVAATDGRYALEDGFNVDAALDQFAYPRGRVRGLGPSAETAVGSIGVFHRRFDLAAAEPRSCVGIKASWDDVAYDPRRRPAKLLLGYYCAAPNVALDDAAIERLVAGLRLRPPPDVALRGTPAETRAALLREARGGEEGEARGVPDFPLNLARHYEDKDRVGLLELAD